MRSDASDARDDLRALRTELDAESLLEGDGIEELEASSARFDEIGDRLQSPLLAPVRWLPVAGRQLSAATHQADAAATGLQAAADLGGELEVLVDRGLGSGPARVATLREVAATVDRSRPTFADLDLGPGDALVAPLADARLEIEEALTEVVDGLDRTVASSTGFADFFEGPSDYLLLAANNAQMQNGQGMFLSAGILHVEDGRMDLGPMESLEKPPELAMPPVELDADLEARWGWLNPNDDLRHLGLSHRFPVTAATASELWAALGHPPVDGVVAVDPHMLKAILEATGPVATPDGERGSDEVLAYLLHDQYQGYLSGGADKLLHRRTS